MNEIDYIKIAESWVQFCDDVNLSAGNITAWVDMSFETSINHKTH